MARRVHAVRIARQRVSGAPDQAVSPRPVLRLPRTLMRVTDRDTGGPSVVRAIGRGRRLRVEKQLIEVWKSCVTELARYHDFLNDINCEHTRNTAPDDRAHRPFRFHLLCSHSALRTKRSHPPQQRLRSAASISTTASRPACGSLPTACEATRTHVIASHARVRRSSIFQLDAC